MTLIALGATVGVVVSGLVIVGSEARDPMAAYLMTLGAVLGGLWGWGI